MTLLGVLACLAALPARAQLAARTPLPPAVAALSSLPAPPEPAPTLPHVSQETDTTCGPACLRSVLLSRDLPAPPEPELARLLGTTPADGTGPDELAAGARRFGLEAVVAEGLRLRDLLKALQRGTTPIVHHQSGGEGHWAAVTAVDGRRVELMDPWAKAERTQVPLREFLRRWHGSHLGREYRRSAVLVGP